MRSYDKTTNDQRHTEGLFFVINDMKKDRIIGNFATGGAVAAMFYLEPSSTMDVDVFVTLKPTPGKQS